MERRFPREIWVERVARWRESGQSAADFARAYGLKVDRLRHWGWRVYTERDAATPTAETSPPRAAVVMPFDEVERAEQLEAPTPMPTAAPQPMQDAPVAAEPPAAPAPTVAHAEVASAEPIEIITPSGLRVSVPAKFDDDALRRVLAVVVR